LCDFHYRECIHPRIPQLAILGYSEHPSALFTTEMRTKWLANFLAGQFKVPTIREMEKNVMRWENCMRHYNQGNYKRSCGSVLLQIHCNDELLRDMNCNPRRKKTVFSEFFFPYSPLDYAEIL
jgi:dimethylaniline monooxygenase (N-oxide forming)